MSRLWTSAELKEATGGLLRGEFTVQRLIIDSRKVEKGDFFVALPGERFDGHDFVAKAIEAGACGALVSRVPENLPTGASYILVEDTLAALGKIAVAARARFKGKVIGVTGSVGKTSAKEMLKTALSGVGTAYATSGNFNNHIGMPLTLANLPPKSDFAVLEMGMNHGGEIEPLSKLARPHAVLITAVEAVHIEFFDSISGIARAKAEIFAGLEKGGTAVLIADTPEIGTLKAEANRQHVSNIITFGTKKEAQARLIDYQMDANGTLVEARIGETHLRFRLGAHGKHWAVLSLGVMSVIDSLKLDIAACAAALATFRDLPGRGAVQLLTINGKEIVIIDDSYNASPVSMRAALSKLAELHALLKRRGRRIAVLGEMLELGPESAVWHRGLAENTVECGIDSIFCSGTMMKHLYEALPESRRGGWWKDSSELYDSLVASIGSGDTLMIKGSHGSGMYRIAEKLMTHGQAAGKGEHADAL